ncbi:DeoR/GlpR family DNA-binding transcription regulator [Rhodovibrionaceae bacterium A322]
MSLSDRQALIAELVRAEGFQTIEGLALRFKLTTQTIRRDVNELCAMGTLLRRHGGVERPPTLRGNLNFQTRTLLNHRAKLAIANAVSKRVPDGASMAFSIGTTPALVMEKLLSHRNLRILTNNLPLAAMACRAESFEVFVAGGRLRNDDHDVVGREAEDFFAAYKVDIGVFGVGAIDADGCLLDFHENEVRARQAILKNCRFSILVADASKFGRSALVRGGLISDVDLLVTDAPLDPELEALAASKGTEVEIVEQTVFPAENQVAETSEVSS